MACFKANKSQWNGPGNLVKSPPERGKKHTVLTILLEKKRNNENLTVGELSALQWWWQMRTFIGFAKVFYYSIVNK